MFEPKEKSRVALVVCTSYEREEVKRAVARAVGLMGGFSAFINPADSLLLKPNLLAATPPERAVTTHPVVFRAVGELLQENGYRPSFGDGPGVVSFRKASAKAGLQQVARSLTIPEVDFNGSFTRHFSEGLQNKVFEIFSSLAGFNNIISLPKFKTHDLTRITCAVKNQYGCLTFRQKREFHAILQQPEHFAGMLLDLNRCIGPRLYIADAVDAMQGKGPMNGTPYRLGVVAVSDDALALDATLCRIVDLDPYLVLYLSLGEKRGYGNVAAENIEILGEPPEKFLSRDFSVNRKKDLNAKQRAMLNFVFERLSKIPVIDSDKCTRCGDCEKACPTDPKAILFPDNKHTPRISYTSCIQCYCCAENCTHGAIRLRIKGFRNNLYR